MRADGSIILMSRRVRIAFASLLILLIGTAAVSYWNVRNLLQAANEVALAHEARAQMSDLFSTLQDAETGERGFIITGNPAYLKPYYGARDSGAGRFAGLRALTADNGEQQRLIAELEELASIKFREIERAIRARNDQDFAAAAQEVIRGTGKAAMDAIRAVIAQMEVNEKQTLAERTRRTRQAALVASITFSVAALLAVGLLVELRTLLRRQLAERERINAELESLNRAKDQFLATLSHELRSPLSPIVIWARMLRGGKLNAEQTEHALEVIERSALSQARLVDDLLDVSRIIAGTMRLDAYPVDCARVIERAVEAVRPAAAAKMIHIEPAVPGNPTQVAGDAERLQQVVVNLLSNAVKFTPNGGRVNVDLRRLDTQVEIAVADTGQGIPEEFLPHVFDRFAQADSSTTRTHAGLGLGLAIVRHIVELHGGRVVAESPGNGQGATFRITLPAFLGASPAAETDGTATGVEAPRLPTLRGVRVLVVDDETESNEVACALLRSRGAVVRAAASTAQALEMLHDWTPDVLVADIGMPGQDGYELIAKIRALPGIGPILPAIAWTGFASEQDRNRLLSAGFQAHVAKPAEPETFLAAVAQFAEVRTPA